MNIRLQRALDRYAGVPLCALFSCLDRLYHRLPAWGVGVLCGVVLLLIEAVGGDGAAPFIYFQF